MFLADLCVMSGLCLSKKQAKRLISQGAIRINDIQVNENLKVGIEENKVYLYSNIDGGKLVHNSCVKGNENV